MMEFYNRNFRRDICIEFGLVYVYIVPMTRGQEIELYLKVTERIQTFTRTLFESIEVKEIQISLGYPL